MTDPKIAVVTGGAQGIGMGIVTSLLATGVQVVVADACAQALARVPKTVGDKVDRVMPLQVDVTCPEDWVRLRLLVEQRLGPVDILVNNAAISPKHRGAKVPTHQLDLAEWESVLAVNLTGAFLGVRTLIEPMTERGWGRVVTISSQAARTGSRVASAHYGATKAALLGLSRTIAHEYGPFGVTANTIAPGRIRTLMAEGVSAGVNEDMRKLVPVGRLGEPADIGAAVAYLASDAAGYINGATIDINGGSWMG